jgi:hypothetical protein
MLGADIRLSHVQLVSKGRPHIRCCKALKEQVAL